MYKKISLIFFVTLFANQLLAQELPNVDSENQTWFYKLGGGKVVYPPGSGYVTHTVTARFKGGFGYSCGKFDFHENLTQMINQIETKVRQIPLQLQSAASAAVAGLPGYIMQKTNPNLYNIVTKTLDETTELFRLSFKSCQQMEQEMRQNGSEYNPYDNFMSAVAANKWVIYGNSGENITDAKDQIDKDPTGTITWLGDNEYGTADHPIQINHDLAMAGYNIMLGRTDDVSTDAIPTGALSHQPIVKIWPKPSAAGDWIQQVTGDFIIVTEDDEPTHESVTGKGLRPVVEILEPQIRNALQIAVESYDFAALNKFSTMQVSAGLVDGLRAMPLAQRVIILDRLVSEMAVNEAFERVSLLRQMLLMGLNNPDNVAAKISALTEEHVRTKTFPDIDIAVNEIFDALALKRSTTNSTALTIINHHNAQTTSGVAVDTGVVNEEPTLVNGGVSK